MLGPQANGLTQAAIRGLHKLMAYKDEYEVARLFVQGTFQARTRAMFVAPARVSYNFHPPLLRALGLRRKLHLGAWFTPVLRILASLKVIRGTPFDLFGYTKIRRLERGLIPWYVGLVERTLEALNAEDAAVAQAILDLPDEIRGYEDVKLRNVVAARRKAEELTAALR